MRRHRTEGKAGHVLAITSHVVYGHVGGQATVPALQRHGHEVWHLPTVLFSNHPGHGGFAGDVVAPALLRRIVDGLGERGFLEQVDAVLSGYLGTAETADVVADTVRRLRRDRAVVYCCDPVLGDAGRRYVADGILEAVRDRLLPLADILTPNRDELGWLAGRTVEGLAHVLAAAEALRAAGAGSVVCTSASQEDGRLGNVVVCGEGRFAVEVTQRDGAPHGTGDLFSALFLAARLDRLGDAEALARASAQTAAVIEASLARGADELALIPPPEALAGSPEPLPVRRLG